MVKSLFATRDEFIAAWQGASCVSDVSKATGISPRSCSSRARYYREIGIQMKDFDEVERATTESQLTGQRFGRLVVLGLGPLVGHGVRLKVRCDCGKEKIVRKGELVRKSREGVLSCGCLMEEEWAKAVTTHGMSKSRVWNIWSCMLSRCYYDKHVSFRYYGARGIKVCDRWRESFESFYADMGDPPSDSHSLDRYPNNDGNYEPGNCRWATSVEQASNRRKPWLVYKIDDGKHVFMVATQSRREAFQLLGVTDWHMRRYGERHKSGSDFQVAMSEPGRVWRKLIDFCHEQPWLYAPGS